MKSGHIAGSCACLLGLLALATAGDVKRTSLFEWPDASHYNRVIVNAQQGVESYPKEWFSRDSLVTDLTIANAYRGDSERAKQQYRALRELLASYGIAAGTYISGTTVEPLAAETKYPFAVVPSEAMPESARYVAALPEEADRRVIDVTDAGTRQAFQAAVKTLWEESPAAVRFIDNAAIHRSAGTGQPWPAYCQNIKELRQLGEAMGSVQIFNVPVHVGELSDVEAAQLIDAIGSGGLLLEMPWHAAIRKDAAATERARLRYRQLLDSGMAVIMAEPGAEPSTELVAWVNSWRKPTDHLYFAGAFWKQPDLKRYTAQ